MRRMDMGRWVLAALILVGSTAIGAEVKTWRHTSASDFAAAKKEGVVVSDAGRVRLARAMSDIGRIEAERVWDLARIDQGTVFAATGNAGKVFRREPDGAWSLVLDAEDSQVLSLAALPAGRIVAGTGPSGQVIELVEGKPKVTTIDSSVKYVWDLAADRDGNLYAATGPDGGLWRRSRDGTWTKPLDSKHAHLLCVALGPDGSVYAGSDGEGLVYRVDPDGKVSVVYDAAQSEVRSLLVAPDGSLYAGTAADAGGGSSGGSTARGLASLSSSTVEAGGPVRAAVAVERAVAVSAESTSKESAGGTAAPKSPAPGENAVYRIDSDGSAREVFRAKALVFALAWSGDGLLVGTGPEGTLHEVRGRESAAVAKVDHGQVLALLADGPDLLVGAGDPGAVLSRRGGNLTSGQLTSEVLDAKLASRFGAITWAADSPPKTKVTIQLRTGNVGEPDATWSAWSPELTTPGSRADAPPGRFAQYRVRLASESSDATPELRSIAVHYQTVNLAPEIVKLTVPDLTDGDGATRQTRLTLKWEASDPNGDELSYRLAIRKDGWPDWIELGAEPITSKSFEWDTTAVPAGTYRLRVSASDRPSNPAESSHARSLTSEPFVVDHQSPRVALTVKDAEATIALADDLTRLVKASYSLDGRDWTPIFPDDGLFDTAEESLTLALSDLKPGTHVLMVRATDSAGNVGSGDAVVVIGGK